MFLIISKLVKPKVKNSKLQNLVIDKVKTPNKLATTQLFYLLSLLSELKTFFIFLDGGLQVYAGVVPQEAE